MNNNILLYSSPMLDVYLVNTTNNSQMVASTFHPISRKQLVMIPSHMCYAGGSRKELDRELQAYIKNDSIRSSVMKSVGGYCYSFQLG